MTLVSTELKIEVLADPDALGAKAEPRITLTYPVLESRRHTAFLVAGEEKRVILSRIRQRDDSLPATHLRPVGSLCAFVDAAATQDVA